MSKETLVSKIEVFESGYGKILTWIFRILLLPFLSLGMYSTNLYLDAHYVPRTYFDESMTVLSTDKKAYAGEVKTSFETVNGKLDLLIIGNASNAQRFTDFERRLGSLETKVDRAQESRK